MSETKCFFFNEQMCGGDIMPLSNFRYESINIKCFPGASSLIEIILLCDDRFYQHPLSLHTTSICSVHKMEFLKQYWPSSYRRCWLCISLEKQSPNTSERNINPVQALTIFEQYHISHSYGKTICRRCREAVTTHINNENISKHEKAFEWINYVYLSDDDTNDFQSDDNSEAFVPNCSPDKDIQSITNTKKKKRELLQQYLSLCGSDKEVKISPSYDKLSKQSKANFLSHAKHLIQHILEFLAPCHSADLQKDLFMPQNESTIRYDRHFIPIMRGIAEAYNNAENRSTRRSILSIVAPKIEFSTLQSLIPNITKYQFCAARLLAYEANSGILLQRPPQIICRFETAQVEHFIDFIISNYVCTDMPFGQRTLKLSDGTKLNVPDTIRNSNSSRIITQYYKYTTELYPGFSALHESTLFKILAECKASTRRAISGLNYFAANGSEAFDSIIQIVDDLNVDASEHHRLIDNIKQGKQYLKTDFKINVARESRVRDHCICFALSDLSSSYLSKFCSDHDHDQVCSECLYLAQALHDVSEAIQNKKDDPQEIKRKMHKFNLANEAIQTWKCHQIRSVNQDLGRDCLLDIISDDTVYLNLDFAMKWLPVKYREAQNDFFGKRGITWHITVVSRKRRQTSKDIITVNNHQNRYSITASDQDQTLIEEFNDNRENGSYCKKNSNDFEHTVFVHVLNQCSQDSKLVVAIITDVLSRLKKYDPSIEQACLRSDNAGCYHSAATILSMPAISEKSHISIRRMDFADPQGGKGSSDRYAAVIKSHVRRYLNEKHDVTNAQQFVEACLFYGGVKNVDVIECQLKPIQQSARFQFSNIKQFRNFCFERHGIRVFRAWDVGDGYLLSYDKLIHGKVNIGLLDIITSSSQIVFGSSNAEYSNSVTNEDLNVEPKEMVNKVTKLFECSEEGCIDSFVKYGNLLRHLALGDHHRMSEKITLLDTAKKLYHSRLTNAENKRVISLSSKYILFDSNNFDDLPELKTGWALPSTRSPVRFTVKQKQFLDEKFNDGMLHGRFWKPETVVNEMENAKSTNGNYLFDTNEWLTSTQVRSYFSRIRSTNTKKNDTLSSSGTSKYTLSLTNEDDHEEQYSDEEADAEESLKDDAAGQEEIERITLINEINQLAERATKEKRPLSSTQSDTNTPKRSITPLNPTDT